MNPIHRRTDAQLGVSATATPEKWLRKLITLRLSMIAAKRNQKNALQMIEICGRLKLLLEGNRYKGKTLASFFVRHSDDIYNILPGKGAACHRKYMREYEQFLNDSREALQCVSKYQVTR